MTPSITQDGVNQALGNLLTAMLPQLAGKIVVGQVNRVAEPEGDFIVMWPLRRPRLGTNIDSWADCAFQGAIADTVLTVATVTVGEVQIGNTLFGTDVAAGTTITAQLSGPSGGAGTYTVSVAQTLGSQVLASGAIEVMESVEAVYQVDVHGPASADNAQVIASLWRDEFSVKALAGAGLSPLFADDPRQMPFINAASQYEDRWTIDLHLQIDPAIAVPQQFADAVTVGLYDVDQPPQN